MKKIIICAVALFAAIGLNAQPGGFGGPGMGGGMPMGGGPGMGMGMMSADFDPFADMRKEYSETKTQELTEALSLTAKQAKKVKKIYAHTDTGLVEEFRQMMELMGGMQGGFPGMPGGFQGAPQGGFPGGFQMPEGAPQAKPQGEQAEGDAKAEDGKPATAPGEGAPAAGGQGQHGFGGPGFGGPGFGGPGAGGFGMPGGWERPKNIPVSAKERQWRKEQMAKILSKEQYAKWLDIDAQDNKFPF